MTTLGIASELRQTQPLGVQKGCSSASSAFPSCCQRCRFYKLEGRRGGYCQKMAVQVSGRWVACALAQPSFAPSCEAIS